MAVATRAKRAGRPTLSRAKTGSMLPGIGTGHAVTISTATAKKGTVSPAEFLYNDIRHAGAYYHVQTGALLRIFPSAFSEGGLKIMAQCVPPWTVIKLADNPSIPISQACALAANLDLVVKFGGEVL